MRFAYKQVGRRECFHTFHCQGPRHLKEILDRYNISFEDMQHISIRGGQTISRSKLKQLFKTGEYKRL